MLGLEGKSGHAEALQEPRSNISGVEMTMTRNQGRVPAQETDQLGSRRGTDSVAQRPLVGPTVAPSLISLKSCPLERVGALLPAVVPRCLGPPPAVPREKVLPLTVPQRTTALSPPGRSPGPAARHSPLPLPGSTVTPSPTLHASTCSPARLLPPPPFFFPQCLASFSGDGSWGLPHAACAAPLSKVPGLSFLISTSQCPAALFHLCYHNVIPEAG